MKLALSRAERIILRNLAIKWRLVYLVRCTRVMGISSPTSKSHRFGFRATSRIVTMGAFDSCIVQSVKHMGCEMLATPTPSDVLRSPHLRLCWPTIAGGDSVSVELDRPSAFVIAYEEHFDGVQCRWRWLSPLRALLYPDWQESYIAPPQRFDLDETFDESEAP